MKIHSETAQGGVYDRIYSRGKLMGTQIDTDYNSRTKSDLLDFAMGRYLGFSPIPFNINICDFGSGDGIFMNTIHERDFLTLDVFPIEISHEGCKRIVERKASNTDFINMRTPVQYNGLNIPFNDHSIGIVLAADVMEHVRDLPVVLNELNRVLEPGGIFAMNIPLPNFERNYIRYKMSVGDWKTLFKMFKAAFVRKLLLGSANFQDELGETRMITDEWIKVLSEHGFRLEDRCLWPEKVIHDGRKIDYTGQPLSGILILRKIKEVRVEN